MTYCIAVYQRGSGFQKLYSLTIVFIFEESTFLEKVALVDW